LGEAHWTNLNTQDRLSSDASGVDCPPHRLDAAAVDSSPLLLWSTGVNGCSREVSGGDTEGQELAEGRHGETF